MISNINYIKDEVDIFLKNKSTMNENIVALLNHYVEVIIKDGINSTRQKIGLEKVNTLTDSYDELIDLYKYDNMDILINQIEAYNNKIDIINVIIFYCIKLYKYSQLVEFKLNNFNNIKFIANSNCCELCKTKAKFKNEIDELMNDIHPFCKDIYDVNVNEQDVNAFLKKLKIMIPQYIKDIDIKLLNEIDFNFIDGLTDEQKEKIESIKDTVICYSYDNKLLINSKKCNDLYHTVLLNVFNFSFEDNIIQWFKNKYEEKIKHKNVIDDVVIYKEPFVSFISEIDYSNYLKESIVYYIIDKEKLIQFDKDTFDYIKENIFNNMEFR